MAYIVSRGLPYFFNGKEVYPCSISADKVVIRASTPVKEKIKFDCVYTESEIKQRLGIMMIDGWDNENQKLIKVSNQTISSIPEDKEEDKEDKEESEKEK